MSDPLPSASPPEGDIAVAIARHTHATTTTLTRVLAATSAAFEEPRASNPELALHHLTYLVETLLGAAAGGVIGRVVAATVRSLGRDVGPSMESRLREALRHIGPGRTAPRAGTLTASLPTFSPKAARPLVDELNARLYPRLARATRDHQEVLARIASAIPGDRVASFATTLRSLDADPMLAHLWGEHLAIGWACYTAAVASEPDTAPVFPPDLEATAASSTWLTWLRRVRGEAVSAKPAAAPSGDYIMAVH